MLLCPVCASRDVVRLSVPHPERSMTSDGRVMNRPLEKVSCTSCGHGFHANPPMPSERDDLYGESYDLGQRDPEADASRAAEYLRHIQDLLTENRIAVPAGSSIAEFGCGSGALLTLLADELQVEKAFGIEPAAQLAMTARGNATSNVEVLEVYAEDGDLDAAGCSMAVSINVAEHAFEPVAFLSAMHAAVNLDGIVVVVCPDGDVPGSELLFRDHISSFSTSAFAAVATQAGLRLAATRPLTGRQSGFRIFLLRPTVARWKDSITRPEVGLTARRDAYLAGWRGMEEVVLASLRRKRYAIFGTGEYSDLLNAYCPALIEGALVNVVDRPMGLEWRGRPVISLDDYVDRNDGTVLVAAVNPRSWARLKSRLDDKLCEAVHPYQFTSLRWML